MNRKALTLLVVLLMSFVSLGCGNQTSTKSTSDTSSISNSKTIATVGNINITELQFEKQKQILKQNFEKLNKPQSDEFYDQGALYSLITTALFDNEVKKEGITVTQQEAIDYLKKIASQVKSLSDSDPAKVQFMDIVKSNGFQSIDDYINSKQLISSEQELLARSKLLSVSGQTAQQLFNKLLAQKNYKILVPIDISGYQEELKKINLNPNLPSLPNGSTEANISPIK